MNGMDHPLSIPKDSIFETLCNYESCIVDLLVGWTLFLKN